MKLVETYGTPLKFTYLPQISNNISKAKSWFRKSMEKNKYEAKYYYCYCTKSSHFEYIMNEAFKNKNTNKLQKMESNLKNVEGFALARSVTSCSAMASSAMRRYFSS